MLSLCGLTIEREICRSAPGDEEQVTEWPQIYDACRLSELQRG